jgi:hypothetical protein
MMMRITKNSQKLTFCSLSEFGCNTNTRQFEEVASLYSTQMTSVYSGGLVYEYSQEEANYGLVTISGDSISERPDFAALQKAYSATPNPTGDGGYKSAGGASQCPPVSLPAWTVSGTDLPAIPAGAVKFMTQGAGPGPGNKGSTGSQNAGTASTGTSSGTTSSSSGTSKTSKAAASSVRVPQFALAPIAAVIAVIVSGVLGGASMMM